MDVQFFVQNTKVNKTKITGGTDKSIADPATAPPTTAYSSRETAQAKLNELPNSNDYTIRKQLDGTYQPIRKNGVGPTEVKVGKNGNNSVDGQTVAVKISEENGGLYSPVKFGDKNTATAHEKGKAGVQLSKEQAIASGERIIGTEISIKLDDGRVTKADILVEKPSGGLKAIECKNGPCAKLTENQKVAKTQLPEKGGVFFGKKAKNSGLEVDVQSEPIEYQVDHHNKTGFEE